MCLPGRGGARGVGGVSSLPTAKATMCPLRFSERPGARVWEALQGPQLLKGTAESIYVWRGGACPGTATTLPSCFHSGDAEFGSWPQPHARGSDSTCLGQPWH